MIKINSIFSNKMANQTTSVSISSSKKPKLIKEEVKHDDKYTPSILRRRYNRFREDYIDCSELIEKTGLPIRHQNPPEDISENIAKFIMINYDNDPTCKWAKSIGVKGDLYSEKYTIDSPAEIKALTSDGPSSFGPEKKFSVIYFLDMRDWLNDKFILWKVNLTSESPAWKEIKMNKKQTFEDQCKEGRRPHISWDNIYPQISEHCVKVYDGTFEGIFTQPVMI